MNEKDITYVNELLDAYDVLLTLKQQQMLNYYYKEDFSLAEIAELMNVSRSAVGDLLKRSEKVLIQYEERLKLVEKFKQRNIIYQKLYELKDKDINSYISDLEKIDENGGNYES
ncbi:MAG: sigma factor-like helix-turn-helix DNA-binding protein [Erysipelotrichaceae bacterium]